MSSLDSLKAKFEQLVGDLIQHIPDPVVRKLAGPPLVIDGRTLEPRIQLAAAAASGNPAVSEVGVAKARRGANRSLADGNAPRAAGVRIQKSRVHDGLPVRIYRAGSVGSAPSPGMLFMHQGGFVVGDLNTCDSFCSRVAAELGVVVVSLDYRLAPEHPFPAQRQDSEAAWAWMQLEAASLGIDPDRVIIAGDSAGGHLSAMLCHQLRDAGGAVPLAQLLVYPFVDGLAEGGSMDSCAHTFPLDRETMQWFAEQYTTDDLDQASPDFSPLHGDLTGLPATIVVTAGFDPLRDQGIAYAASLREAGGTVIDRCEDVLSHSFLSMDKSVPEARNAQTRIISDLCSMIAGTTQPAK